MFCYFSWISFSIICTLAEHLKCIPGTGRVVMYMVMHRYRYSVPTMNKNRRPTIDLPKERLWSPENVVQYFLETCMTSKVSIIFLKKTYLCFKRLHCKIHKMTRIIPLISHTVKAHSTRSKKSKNLSGNGGLTSLGGTRSWTTAIITVVKIKQQMAYNKATAVLPHSVGNEELGGPGIGIRTTSLWKPLTKTLHVVLLLSPAAWPLAWPFTWVSMRSSMVTSSPDHCAVFFMPVPRQPVETEWRDQHRVLEDAQCSSSDIHHAEVQRLKTAVDVCVSGCQLVII